MQISIATITSKPAYAFIACTLALVSYASVANESAGASNEEGIANYASYRNKSYALEAAAKIETQLASSVEINEVEINGSIWLRLHSGPIDAIEAKSLVVRATAAGFPAWYQIAPTASPVTAAGTRHTTTATMAASAPTAADIHNADPRLVAMLPEGPLLGDLYPPRAPLPENAKR